MHSLIKRAGAMLPPIAMVCVSLLVGLLACESFVRWRDGVPLWPLRDMVSYKSSFITTQVAAEYDPLLGWRQKPHFRMDLIDLVTGDLGVRMNSAAVTPLPTQAILAVGDSFTVGSEVTEPETFPAQLEQLLQRPVINAGVGGYGTDQAILRAETLMPRLSPAAIVVGILDDDINRTGYRVYGGAPKPWFEMTDGRLVHHNNPVPPPTLEDEPILRWLAYSYLAVWATERTGYGHIWQRRNYTPARNDPVAVTCALLDRLKRSTDTAGIPLYVVMLYSGIDRMGTMNTAVEKPAPIAVGACSARLGIATVDLMRDLVDLARNDPATYRGLYRAYPQQPGVYGHMTPAGNAFVAQKIAARMTIDASIASRQRQSAR